MSAGVLAESLTPGMMIDVPPDLVEGTDNEAIVDFEYAVVEQVNGGWMDNAAAENEIVIYTTNFAVPIVCPSNRPIKVVDIVSPPL